MELRSFRDRLAFASKALVGVFSEDAAKKAYGMLAGIMPGGRGEPPRKGTKEYLEAYKTMPWLRACVDRVVDGMTAVTWRLYTQQGKGLRATRNRTWQHAGAVERVKIRKQLQLVGELKEIVDHPMLSLLTKGNSYHTGRQVRRISEEHILLAGEGFGMKERNLLGAPVAQWPLPPDWVKATPTPANPFFEVGFRGWHGQIPHTEMMWIQNPDPANPYSRGTGLVQALADELDADEGAARHTRNWFYGGARPDLIVYGEGFTPEDTRQLEEGWMQKAGNFWRKAKPFFLNRKIEVKEIAQNFEQQQLVEIRQHERDTIVQVFGIPPEIMGIIENSNRATIEAASYILARHVLVPRLEDRREYLQERLVPEYDERLVVEYESPVAEDREFELKAMQAAPWAFKADEFRDQGGKAPLEDGEGEVKMVPFGLQPTMDLRLAGQAGEKDPTAVDPEAAA